MVKTPQSNKAIVGYIVKPCKNILEDHLAMKDTFKSENYVGIWIGRLYIYLRTSRSWINARVVEISRENRLEGGTVSCAHAPSII